MTDPTRECSSDAPELRENAGVGAATAATTTTIMPAPQDLVFPFGAHKGSTIAHVMSVDKQHLTYFAGKNANYKRSKWLKQEHAGFYATLQAFCVEHNLDAQQDVDSARAIQDESRFRRW